MEINTALTLPCQNNLSHGLQCTKDLASTQGFYVKVMSEICSVFHGSKTWLQPRVLMSRIFRVVHASKTWLPSMVLMSGS